MIMMVVYMVISLYYILIMAKLHEPMTKLHKDGNGEGDDDDSSDVVEVIMMVMPGSSG